MTTGLVRRDTAATERMDDPDCDRACLERTYAQFRIVNALVGRWRDIYRREIRARGAAGAVRVLDLGCGGADVAARLARWADRDGVDVEVTAVDPDARAIRWARERVRMPRLTLRVASSAQLVATGERFDVVLSNHVLHHLSRAGLEAFLGDSVQLLRSGGVAIHRDLVRGRLPYTAFAAVTAMVPATHRRVSFLREDGLLSIRRSYTARELAHTAGSRWRVSRAFPAHLEVRRTAG